MKKMTVTVKFDNAHDAIRHTWDFRPTTRVVESKKVYKRQNGKNECRMAMRGE